MRGSFLSVLPFLAAAGVGATTTGAQPTKDAHLFTRSGVEPARVFLGSDVKRFGMYCRATRRNGNKRTKRGARKFRKTNKY